MTPDRLTIHSIRFRAPCGVFAEERALKMDYTAAVTLEFDMRPAAKADDLLLTIDYDRVARTVREVAARERKLVERLAEDIAGVLLSTFAVDAVEVAVTKERPPVESMDGGVTVTLRRERPFPD